MFGRMDFEDASSCLQSSSNSNHIMTRGCLKSCCPLPELILAYPCADCKLYKDNTSESVAKAFTKKDGAFWYENEEEGKQAFLSRKGCDTWKEWKTQADDPDKNVHGPMTPKQAYQAVDDDLRFFTNFKPKWVRLVCFLFFVLKKTSNFLFCLE